jgi:hypothetical protein
MTMIISSKDSKEKPAFGVYILAALLGSVAILWGSGCGLSHKISNLICQVDVGVILSDEVYFYNNNFAPPKTLTNVKVTIRIEADDGKHVERTCNWDTWGIKQNNPKIEKFDAVFSTLHAPDRVYMTGSCDQGKINILWNAPKYQNVRHLYSYNELDQ